jgi:basic membrane lipoprotein Med (substrate-binding protein (PBP1-ABC) superfamily)
MKKMLAVLLALALVFAFAACAGDTQEPSGGQQPAGETGTGLDWSNIKIGVICNASSSDGGWGTAISESIKQFTAERGLSADQVIWVEGIQAGTEDVDNIIAELVDDGCQAIIAHSGGYTSQFAVAATKYPDVYFAGFECKVESDNAMMYSISDYQSEFMCGYLSALMSDSNELGFVATMPTTTICRLVNAFAQGVKYANPDATVQVIFTSSWYDPAKEKEAAATLIAKGITALGYSGSNSSVAVACTEAGGKVYCTGNYVDMLSYGPGAVLTSHLINWDAMLDDVATKVIEGTWDGKTAIYTMAQGAANVTEPNPDLVPADVAAKFAEVKKQVTNGEIDVFPGPLSDNQGNVLAAEGEKLEGTDLLSVTYLVDNVIGNLP